MSRPIIFGEIEPFKEGYHFANRKEMMPSSFHRSWVYGIDGNGREGSAAIVLSGGYEDDEDHGDVIIYTGAGGNKNGKQIKDQSWETSGNAGLIKSMNEGHPIRVIRGFQHISTYSPNSGYTYAGLYSVVDAWEEIGKSGFKICRFRMVYSGDNYTRKTPELAELDHSTREKTRKKGVVMRIVRDSKISNTVKRLYDYKCQVCGISINTRHGQYAEGAHIRPLGKPHNGDDSISNIICLCPNHHVMLDKGGISIKDDFSIIGEIQTKLFVEANHQINIDNFSYHRDIHGYD